MLDFINELYENLDDDLKFISEDLSEQEKNQPAILIVKDAINLLKEQMTGYQFQNEKDEINFFANSLPLFYSKLIFHIRLFNLDTNRLGIGRKTNKELMQDEL